MILDLSPIRKHRDFRLLLPGQLVSMFGSMITYVAVPYQVYELTKSSFLVGMLGATQLIPLLVFALWGGAYADAPGSAQIADRVRAFRWLSVRLRWS